MPAANLATAILTVGKEAPADQAVVWCLLVKGNHDWNITNAPLLPDPLQDFGRSNLTLPFDLSIADLLGVAWAIGLLLVVVLGVDSDPDGHPLQLHGITAFLHVVLLFDLLDVHWVWIALLPLSWVQARRITLTLPPQPVLQRAAVEVLAFLEDVVLRRENPLRNLGQAVFKTLQVVLVVILADVDSPGLASLVTAVLDDPLVVSTTGTSRGVILG